ncbi:hypothetical protein AAC387_Pa05g1384 [Persea americana]
MSTIIWNVRGARRRALHGQILHLLTKFKPSMMILLETKVESVSNNRTFKLLSNHLPSSTTIPETDHGGGIWICRDPSCMDVELLNKSTKHITLARTFIEDRATKGFFTAIYASPFTLQDLGYHGSPFTWSNMRTGPTRILECWIKVSPLLHGWKTTGTGSLIPYPG